MVVQVITATDEVVDTSNNNNIIDKDKQVDEVELSREGVS